MDQRNLGGHRLIQQGAHLLTEAEEIFQTLGYRKKISEKEKEKRLRERDDRLTEEEKILLGILSDGPQHIDKILHSSQFPAPLASSRLIDLTMKGLVAEHPGKLYEIIDEN